MGVVDISLFIASLPGSPGLSLLELLLVQQHVVVEFMIMFHGMVSHSTFVSRCIHCSQPHVPHTCILLSSYSCKAKNPCSVCITNFWHS